MKDENLENTVVTLHVHKGWSIRKISRDLGISRGRIRRMLLSHAALRTSTPPADKIPLKKPRSSKLDPYKELIAGWMNKYAKLTSQRVYELLREEGYDGGITICRQYVRSLRGMGSKTPVRMVETSPGELAAHDWSDYVRPVKVWF